MKERTTSSATSASIRARRTSRIASLTSASDSAPRRVSRSRTEPRRSERVSNMRFAFCRPAASGDGPVYRPRQADQPSADRARGRIALADGDLRDQVPVGGSKDQARRIAVEVSGKPRRVQENRRIPPAGARKRRRPDKDYNLSGYPKRTNGRHESVTAARRFRVSPRSSHRVFGEDQLRLVAPDIREHLVEVRDLGEVVLADVGLVRVEEGVVLVIVLRRVEHVERLHLGDDRRGIGARGVELVDIGLGRPSAAPDR